MSDGWPAAATVRILNLPSKDTACIYLCLLQYFPVFSATSRERESTPQESAHTNTHTCVAVTARVPAESCAQYSRLLENILARQRRRRRRWLCRCHRQRVVSAQGGSSSSSGDGIKSRAELSTKFTCRQHNKNFSRLFSRRGGGSRACLFQQIFSCTKLHRSRKLFSFSVARKLCKIIMAMLCQQCELWTRQAQRVTCKSNPHLAVCVPVCVCVCVCLSSLKDWANCRAWTPTEISGLS